MNQNQIFGPIILRYVFFAINFFFTVQTTSNLGWNFLSILLAMFATRDFVHATRLSVIYLKLRDHNQNQSDK